MAQHWSQSMAGLPRRPSRLCTNVAALQPPSCASPTSVRIVQFFARDLAAKIAELRPQGCSVNIGLKNIGLLPEQILELKIPMVQGSKEKNEGQEKYKNFLKPYCS